jgi:hypothetical protein
MGQLIEERQERQARMGGPCPFFPIFKAMDRLAQRPGERIRGSRPIEGRQFAVTARPADRGQRITYDERFATPRAERRGQRRHKRQTGGAKPFPALVASGAARRENEIKQRVA